MMEGEAGAVEDVVETSECGGGEDRPLQGRSEALDESSEVGGRRRRVLEEEVEWFVSHF